MKRIIKIFKIEQDEINEMKKDLMKFVIGISFSIISIIIGIIYFILVEFFDK